MTSREKQYLLDILLAAEDALAFVRDVSWETFPTNRLVRRGVLGCLTEIGEAAGRIEAAAELERPDLSWRKMKNLRNVIVHDDEGRQSADHLAHRDRRAARGRRGARPIVPGAPETMRLTLN